MPSALLGYLEKINDAKSEHGQYGIREGEELLIGRDRKSCHIVLDDATISNRHLRIYSVIYDPNAPSIDPFVYAEDLSTNGSRWLPKIQCSQRSFSIGKGNAFLLSDGDRIVLCDGTLFAFVSSSSSEKLSEVLELDEIQEVEKGSFSNHYQITNRKLGAGGTGEVFMAIDVWNRCQVACKAVNLIKSKAKRPEVQPQPNTALEKGWHVKLWREVELLKRISHPNIITVKRVFHTEHNLYIIEDLVTGGDLVSYIEHKGGWLNDSDACIITYQLLQAVQYLHGERIVHRDIKPENILMSPTATGPRVILTDFGGAIKEVGRGSRARRMQTLCGTLEFVAPEVRGDNKTVKQLGYTMAVDMWSVGCVTSALLAGKSYFVNTQDSEYRHNSSAAIIKAAAECDLDRLDSSSAWLGVEQQTKDFLKRLLVLDEKTRLTVKQALEHSWFTEGSKRLFLEQTYTRIVEGWKRWSPGWDFVEHLDRYIKARTPQTVSRRQLLLLQKGEEPTQVGSQLQSKMREPLSASGIQDTSQEGSIRAEHSGVQTQSPLRNPEESIKTTHSKSSRRQNRSISLKSDEVAIYAELEDDYRLRNPVLEQHLSPDRDNNTSSHYFLNTLRTSSTSCHTAASNQSEEAQGVSTTKRRMTTVYDHEETAVYTEAGETNTTKRRRTTIYDYEEAAIYTQAGKENRGFVSAKTYGQVVAKKRSERGK